MQVTAEGNSSPKGLIRDEVTRGLWYRRQLDNNLAREEARRWFRLHTVYAYTRWYRERYEKSRSRKMIVCLGTDVTRHPGDGA